LLLVFFKDIKVLLSGFYPGSFIIKKQVDFFGFIRKISGFSIFARIFKLKFYNYDELSNSIE